jgi:hypothetical protein
MLISAASPAFGAVAPTLALTPAALNFGNVAVGSSSSQQLTITNKVSARVTISALPISGSGAGGYRISGITLPKQLAPRASASVTVTFTPANSGSQTASLGITTSSGVVLAQSVPLSGAGVTLMLGLDASLLAYGGVPIGTSAPPIRTATLTNTGTGDLTVSGITVSGVESRRSVPADPEPNRGGHGDVRPRGGRNGDRPGLDCQQCQQLAIGPIAQWRRSSLGIAHVDRELFPGSDLVQRVLGGGPRRPVYQDRNVGRDEL